MDIGQSITRVQIKCAKILVYVDLELRTQNPDCKGRLPRSPATLMEVGGGGSCFSYNHGTTHERRSFSSKLFFIKKLAFSLRGIMLRHAH
jgi:hypothetical protein